MNFERKPTSESVCAVQRGLPESALEGAQGALQGGAGGQSRGLGRRRERQRRRRLSWGCRPANASKTMRAILAGRLPTQWAVAGLQLLGWSTLRALLYEDGALSCVWIAHFNKTRVSEFIVQKLLLRRQNAADTALGFLLSPPLLSCSLSPRLVAFSRQRCTLRAELLWLQGNLNPHLRIRTSPRGPKPFLSETLPFASQSALETRHLGPTRCLGQRPASWRSAWPRPRPPPQSSAAPACAPSSRAAGCRRSWWRSWGCPRSTTALPKFQYCLDGQPPQL